MTVNAHVRHEGLLGATFADGGIGSGYAEGKVLVVRIGQRDLDPEEFQGRPDAEVTGWVMSCSCGWRGQQWVRVAQREDEDLSAHRVYSDYPSPPLETIDDPASEEYSDHIEQFLDAALAELTADHVQDESRLLSVVGRARELGAAWADIAAAAGTTTQAARERWAAAPVEIFTAHHGAQLAALGRLVGDEPTHES